jgi:hypothetical protein
MMHATRTEIVVEDGKNVGVKLLIKVIRKLRTANREKKCVEDEHWLAPGSSVVEADVHPPANAFEYKEELAEGP